MDDMKSYYAQRAHQYEAIYHKPERQSDLQILRQMMQEIFHGKQVLEIACGTGYWTQVIASVANDIIATDINKEVLDVAKAKEYSMPVDFRIMDIYDLPSIKPEVNHVFGGFIWSHIPIEILPKWFAKLRNFAGLNTRFIFIDNNYVEGSNTPINQVDEHGNTYQERILEEDNRYLILKNFPDEEEFREFAAVLGAQIKITQLQYYWVLEMWW